MSVGPSSGRFRLECVVPKLYDEVKQEDEESMYDTLRGAAKVGIKKTGAHELALEAEREERRG